ncbi:MAG: flavodoxin family protein [bacterium]
MHLVVLNGSPHTEGMTATVLRTIVAELEPDHTVEWIDTHRLNVKACRGCMVCRPEGECILPRDDGHRVGESLRRAGMILVGTPTYWGNMTAPLKLLFDRNVTTFESFLPGRPRPRMRGTFGFIVATSGSSGLVRRLPSQAAGAVRSVRAILRGGGVRMLGYLLIGGRATFDQRRDRIEARAHRRGRRLARRLRRGRALGDRRRN